MTSTAVYLESQLTVRTNLVRYSTILNNKFIAPMGLMVYFKLRNRKKSLALLFAHMSYCLLYGSLTGYLLQCTYGKDGAAVNGSILAPFPK